LTEDLLASQEGLCQLGIEPICLPGFYPDIHVLGIAAFHH